MTELQAFRNEISNYEFYKNKVKKLYEELDDLFYKFFGVRGVDPSKEALENKNLNVLDEQRLENIEKYDQIRKEINSKILHYEKRISMIEDRMSRMSQVTRNIFEYIYIKHYSYYKTCRLLDISIGELQYNMKKEFKED